MAVLNTAKRIYSSGKLVYRIFLNTVLVYIDNFQVFKKRVLDDGGVFKETPIVFNNEKLLLTPNAYKTGKIFSALPHDGSGDFTFSRNSLAKYIEDGIIKTALPNVPRIQDGKILIEGQSTNVNISSNLFNATGSNLSVLGTSTNTYSPWLTTNIETLVDGVSTALGSFLIRTININCNNFISVSLIVEKSTAEEVAYNFSVIDFRFNFNFVSKALIPLQKVASYTVKEITNNVFLLQVVSNNISFSGNAQFRSGSVLNNSASSKKGIASYVFLQIEEDRLPSSLIPTDGTIVTRLADIATVTPPTGVTEIIETIDGVEQSPITVIPPTYQLPDGEINKVIMR